MRFSVKIIIGFVVLVALAISYIYMNPTANATTLQSKACFNENCFSVELARTPEERARGLMFREYLDADKGMLFIFENEGEHAFWMKNTLIPLDIIWINSTGSVVFISPDTQPCQTVLCPTISNDKNALYVLELNAVTAEKIGLNISDKIELSGIG